MPISLADIEDPTRTIALQFAPDRVLTVTYRMDVITPASSLRMIRAHSTGTEEYAKEFIQTLCSLIVQWDLAGPLPADGSVVPPGELVPVTPEVVSHISTRLLARVLNEIMADFNALPNPTSAGRSRSG
jgi:hypothetical protein